MQQTAQALKAPPQAADTSAMRGVELSRLLARPAVPFFAITGLAFLTTDLHTDGTNWGYVITAELIALWIGGAAWVVPWRRLPRPWLLSLPIACDGIIMLLREAQGGAASGYGALAYLPVIWVGLTLGRQAVLAMTACTAALFALPILFIGEPHYPHTGWRGALLTTVVSLVIGVVVNRTIAAERRQARVARTRLRTMNRLVKTQNAIAASPHDLDKVLDVVVQQALSLSRADSAVVETPDGDSMVYRAVAGGALRHAGLRLPIEGSISGLCLEAKEVLVVEDSEHDLRVDRDACRSVGARSIAVVPLLHPDRVAGVLKVYSAAAGAVTRESAQALALLAAPVGMALVRAELFDQLAEQATTDTLTGLPNRRAWERELALAVARAARSHEALTVVIFDVDGLKRVNDREGHAAGDALLRSVAEAWESVTRTGEMLARIGGDEFGLLLESSDAMAASGAIERLSRSLPHGRTASAGIAEWDGDEGISHLVARADANMYEHKRARAAVYA